MVSTVEKINPEQESLNQVLAAKTMTEMKQVFASLKEQDRISYGVYAPEQSGRTMLSVVLYPYGEVKGVLKKNDKELNDVRTKELRILLS